MGKKTQDHIKQIQIKIDAMHYLMILPLKYYFKEFGNEINGSKKDAKKMKKLPLKLDKRVFKLLRDSKEVSMGNPKKVIAGILKSG